jgi:rhodanese-related sulfurtransferase
MFGLLVLSPLTCLAERRDLTAQELKTMLDSGHNMLLLNPLSDIEFNEGHIPGSVNIPLHMIMKSDKLPKKKDMLVVTYCLSDK